MIEVPQCHDHLEEQCHTLQVILGLLNRMIEVPQYHDHLEEQLSHSTGYYRVKKQND